MQETKREEMNMKTKLASHSAAKDSEVWVA